MSKFEGISSYGADSEKPLVSVCMCTYRRPAMLRQSLEALLQQVTENEFDYVIVVCDNDVSESGRQIVDAFKDMRSVEVEYCVQRERNIAKARNTSLASARGQYVAFIDDDELPERDWLLKLMRACTRYGADGVLGPVRPKFEGDPPSWLLRGRFAERPEYHTGSRLHWSETRTGNALVKKECISALAVAFRPEFGNGGEDADFFRRLVEAGRIFVWCNEAVVHEVVPTARQTRGYHLRRALLRGQNEKNFLDFQGILKSIIAVPAYLLALPIACVCGDHLFMSYAIRLCDHAGKLLVVVGYRVVRGNYLGV